MGWSLWSGLCIFAFEACKLACFVFWLAGMGRTSFEIASGTRQACYCMVAGAPALLLQLPCKVWSCRRKPSPRPRRFGPQPSSPQSGARASSTVLSECQPGRNLDKHFRVLWIQRLCEHAVRRKDAPSCAIQRPKTKATFPAEFKILQLQPSSWSMAFQARGSS